MDGPGFLIKLPFDVSFLEAICHSLGPTQCDQKNVAKCLKKWSKNDFARKIKDFDTFTK